MNPFANIASVNQSGNVESYFNGSYTPTLTNGANVDASAAATCFYFVIGKRVIVSGQFNVDPAASGQFTLSVSLPSSYPVGSAVDIYGVGASGTGTPLKIDVGTGGVARCQSNPVDRANQTITFLFTYTTN